MPRYFTLKEWVGGALCPCGRKYPEYSGLSPGMSANCQPSVSQMNKHESSVSQCEIISKAIKKKSSKEIHMHMFVYMKIFETNMEHL